MRDVPDALRNQLALVTEVRNTLFPNMVGKPLNDPKKAFAITKNVAWRLRAHGVGLVKAKQGSDNNVEGFTSDIVALANGVHWDVLVDGNEGASFPNWAMEENPANYPAIAARWVPAVDPRGTTPAPDPSPTPDPGSLKALIAAEVARAVKDKGFAERLTKFGVDPLGNNPAEFAVLIAAELRLWADAVEIAGVKAK